MVTDITGVKVRGRLVSVQPPSFGTLAKHSLSLPDEPLRAWWADDGVTNGVTWGFLAGIAAGVLITGPACAGAIEGDDSLLACVVLASSLFGGGGGAAVGMIVDSLVHHRELHVDYRPAPQKRTVTVTPVLRKGSGGAMLAIRF